MVKQKAKRTRSHRVQAAKQAQPAGDKRLQRRKEELKTMLVHLLSSIATWPGRVLRRVWKAWCTVYGSLPLDLGSPNEAADSLQLTEDELKEQHSKVSKTIKTIFYILVAACFFSAITLFGKPDADLLVRGSSIQIPILNYKLALSAFLFVAPLTIVLLTCYLHVYLGHKARFDHLPSDKKTRVIVKFCV